ncbi:MAG: hypothetical protein HW380_657 [Magnetococcales bacterium]|nr:hypothetical protein [Magnetococcales bacterium]HIJ85382.1 hypothetical protein [Magnetococcales bacterium]
MAVTYTDRRSLKKHDPGDINWAEGMNANLDDIDDMLGLVLCDAGDTGSGLLSQKVDNDTIKINSSAHKIEANPAAISP